MLKLTPVLKDYLWGGYKLKGFFGRDNGGRKISESWEVSVHPDGLSGCGEGTLADYIAQNPKSVDEADPLSTGPLFAWDYLYNSLYCAQAR